MVLTALPEVRSVTTRGDARRVSEGVPSAFRAATFLPGASEDGRQSDGMVRIVGRHPRALSRPMQCDGLARVPSVRQCFGIRTAGEPELLIADGDRRTGWGAPHEYRRYHPDGGRDLPC